MNSPLVTIQLAVHNGEKYIRSCLSAVKAQTYPNLEVIICDDCSSDRTREIVQSEFPEFELISHNRNLGMWPTHEELLKYSSGEFIVVLSVDVMMDPNFVKHAVAACERDVHIGAVQAKIYRYEVDQPQSPEAKIIDTCGFAITRGRRVFNIGHGKEDSGQYDRASKVFGVEGAVPFFRRTALEDVRIEDHIVDSDFFWYGDDLDLAWRMRLFGWRELYVPNVVAYHDRQTTKSHAHGIQDTIRRVAIRRQIPLAKRRLDWANKRFTIIKNDFIINILKDLPWILKREILVCGYIALFEPRVFFEIPRFIRLLPRMLRRRKEILSRARISPEQIHRWFKQKPEHITE